MWAARPRPSTTARNGTRLAGIFDVVPIEASTYVARTMSDPKMSRPSSVRRLGLGRRARIPSVGARRLSRRGTGSSLLPGPLRPPAPGTLSGVHQRYPGRLMQASEPARRATTVAPPGPPAGETALTLSPVETEDAITARGPERFSNRELSWLEFGARLLD